MQSASWTYSSIGRPNGDFTYTDTMAETSTEGFTLVSQFLTLSLTQKWLCTQDGLFALKLGGTTASVCMKNMITDFKTLEVSGVSLPRVITPGMQWEYKLAMEGSIAMPGENTQSPGTFKLIMQEFGSEPITVPAGTFTRPRYKRPSMPRSMSIFKAIPFPTRSTAQALSGMCRESVSSNPLRIKISAEHPSAPPLVVIL